MVYPRALIEARWKKSSRSGIERDCVEIAQSVGVFGIRDSKLGEKSPILVFAENAGQAFLRAVKSAKF